MNITRTFTPYEVRSARIANAPFQITLVGNPPHHGKEMSTLVLNTETCQRYGIPMSHDIMHREIIATFDSWHLAYLPPQDFDIDESRITDADVRIECLTKVEKHIPSFGILPLQRFDETKRTLELGSFGQGRGRLCDVPCPLYKFVLYLSEEEYEEAKKLELTAVFRVNFKLV